MSKALYDFIAAPITGTLSGFALFVLGTIFSVYLYRKAKPVSRLDYASNDTIILGNRHSIMQDDLEIRYRGAPIPRAATSIFAFWNSGNQTMTGQQIVEADPLRIQLPEGSEILQSYVLASSRPVIAADIRIDSSKRAAIVDFDFLDNGDGFAVFLGHTGSPGDAALTGTIRGAKQGLRRQSKSRAERHFSLWIALFFTILVLVLPIVPQNLVSARIGSTLTLGISLGVVFLSLFGPIVMRQWRGLSFPKEFRRNPVVSGIIPHLLDA